MPSNKKQFSDTFSMRWLPWHLAAFDKELAVLKATRGRDITRADLVRELVSEALIARGHEVPKAKKKGRQAT